MVVVFGGTSPRGVGRLLSLFLSPRKWLWWWCPPRVRVGVCVCVCVSHHHHHLRMVVASTLSLSTVVSSSGWWSPLSLSTVVSSSGWWSPLSLSLPDMDVVVVFSARACGRAPAYLGPPLASLVVVLVVVVVA